MRFQFATSESIRSAQRFLGSHGRTSVTYDWLMVALNTIACTSKLSQKSLRRNLVPIPLVVSGEGN